MIDKDTWIAENVFPKNNNAPRRLRHNVEPVNIHVATRKTKFTLCVLGSWAIYMPPYNLARLSSVMRHAGYLTKVYDFNVDSHYKLKEANPDLADAWNGANYWWWQSDTYYTKVHPTYEPILSSYVDQLISDNPDIIGFSCYYTNMLPSQWVIDQIRARRPDITLIMGGPDCHEGNYVKPDNIDYYFVGESEQNILDFFNNWENGIKPTCEKIGSLYRDTRIDIDSLPYPDYSDFDLSLYWSQNAICAEISRGCIAKCSYCTEVYYWKFRDRGSFNVVNELEYQINHYGITFVSFVDSLMNGNLKEFRAFCEEIVKRNLKFSWWGYARADGRMDREFYELMAAAGCQGFNYGFETGSDKVLVAINKKNTVAEINQNIINSHAVGMKVSACWVIGAPGEDIEAFTHSFNLLWNHRARIHATSPGPGLGDNPGSAYDNRTKFNINAREEPWLGGWFTLDLLNTKLHRFIRIKLMHIWLHICKQSGGTLQNVHASQGDITDHFTVSFDSDYMYDSVEYEYFDYAIIQSDHGDFANSVMNEAFGFLRTLWRVRGGYSITLNFNADLDHRDFIFCIVPNTHSYDASIQFTITEDGIYSIDSTFKFVNEFTDIVNHSGFTYDFKSTGKWEDTSIKPVKIKPRPATVLPLTSCFANVSYECRNLIMEFSRKIDDNSIVLDVDSFIGGRASILAHNNSDINVYTMQSFNDTDLISQFNSMESWVLEQLVDTCGTLGLDANDGNTILEEISNSFSNDRSGYQAYCNIINQYPNIIPITHTAELPMLVSLCIAGYKTSAELYDLAKLVKPNGYMIVYPSIENISPIDGWTIERFSNETLVIKNQL